MSALQLSIGGRKVQIHLASYLDPQLPFISKILAFLVRAELWILSLFTLLLFTSSYFYPDLGIEASVFYFSIYSLFIFLSLYILRFILRRQHHFVDPKGFITVLVFALLTTFAAVMVTQPNASNTFGTETTKMLTGLSTILFVLLYYFVNVKAFHTPSIVSKLLHLVVYSTSLFVVVISLNIIPNAGTDLITLATRGALISIPFYTLFLLQKKPFSVFEALNFVIIIVFLFSRSAVISKDSVFLLGWSLAILFMSVIFIFSILRQRGAVISTYISEIRSKVNDINKKVSDGVTVTWADMYEVVIQIVKLILIITPFISLIIIVLLLSSSQLQPILKNIGATYSQIFLSLKSLTLQVLLFGRGITAVITSDPFIISVFKAQGLLGFAGYVLLFGYSLFTAIRNVQFYIRKRDHNTNISAILLFTTALVITLSFFMYIPFILGIVFWISLSLSCVLLSKKDTDSTVVKFEPQPISFRGKSTGVLRNLLFILFAIVLILAYINLSNLKLLI